MAKIIKIGNSQGIRIPKPIIALAELEDQELDFVVLGSGLLITPEKKVRIGWDNKNEHELRMALSYYLDNYYNERRIHTSIGFKAPVQYEKQAA